MEQMGQIGDMRMEYNLQERHLSAIGTGLPILMQVNKSAAGQGPGALLLSLGGPEAIVGFARQEQIPAKETALRRLVTKTPGGEVARMTVIIFEGDQRHVYQICTLVCWLHFHNGFVVIEEDHGCGPTPAPTATDDLFEVL